jgi:hypothetical protein
VLTLLTRRVVGLIVSTFAVLGFLAVPLGDRTGFQHTRAIFTSREAKSFAEQMARAARDARQKVFGTALGSNPEPEDPDT